MIRSLLLAAVLGTAASFGASAQAGKPAAVAPKSATATPPVAVKAAFAKQFPKSKALRWEKEGGNWEAEFIATKMQASAVFTPGGTFKEVERAVAPATLPAPVLAHLEEHYADQKITEAARIEDAAGTVTWEAEVGKKDVVFDAAGKFLREDVEADDEDGDDRH